MITHYSVTDKGGREQNEDSCICLEKNGIFCFSVADGLGGYTDSRLASHFVHDVLRDLFDSDRIGDDFTELAIKECQKRLLEYKREQKKDSSYTTLVILLIRDGKAQWCHVGDSRLYLIRNGKVLDRTRDHSVPEMLFKANVIKEDEIRGHPDRSKLLRALGRDGEIKADVSDVISLEPGDAFLLCSDGFWDYVDEEVMCVAREETKDVKEWIQVMEQIVREAGEGRNADNFTAVGVICDI